MHVHVRSWVGKFVSKGNPRNLRKLVPHDSTVSELRIHVLFLNFVFKKDLLTLTTFKAESFFYL